jgi:hypothetical protein
VVVEGIHGLAVEGTEVRHVRVVANATLSLKEVSIKKVVLTQVF